MANNTAAATAKPSSSVKLVLLGVSHNSVISSFRLLTTTSGSSSGQELASSQIRQQRFPGKQGANNRRSFLDPEDTASQQGDQV